MGKLKKLVSLILLAGLLSGCLGTRYLQENQKLLYRQTIQAPKGFSKEGLSDLYVQKVNRRLFGLPINSLVWMHELGERKYDQQKFIDKKTALEKKFDQKIAATKSQKKVATLQYRKQEKVTLLDGKIENGNHFMQWGEAAAVFDTASLESSKNKLSDYLFNRGYFQNTVTYKIQETEKRVSVEYQIEPGRPSFYDTIFYLIADKQIDSIIHNTQTVSLIKLNDRYDQSILNKERERIDLQLRDLGYYDFTRQYVEFEVDTSYRGSYQVALQVIINNPPRRDSHKLFRLDSITFTTDAAVNKTDTLKRQAVNKYGITFNYFKSEYSKKLLAQRVSIHKDSLYSRTDSFDTQRQLANLDVFKFINMNYDSSGGKFIGNIFCSPLNKYSWSNEAGFTVTEGFPGPYISTNLKKRNLFGGMEIGEISGRFGFEGVASATDQKNYSSREANINGSITFPQFLFPFKEKTAFRLAKYNPRTRLLAGYTYTDRPEYTRSITTVSDTYTWQNKQRTNYSFTLINLNVIRSTLIDEFDSLLTDLQENEGNNLKNSFNPSFVSSMIFAITWNPDNYGNTERTSHLLRVQAESGGTLFSLAEPGYITSRGLELYQYLRLNLDGRRSKVIDKNTIVSYRFNAGVGYAYGDYNDVLPYEKYFFAGGSNSVRAWLPRRLGVGSVPPNLSDDPENNGLFDYSFEKPGEILLEGSIELRRKLFGFVNGAIFVDAGNVWTFKEVEVSQAGDNKADWTGSSKFSRGFIRDLGVGTGFGLRFDFSFLLLRLDAGLKVYDPGRKEGDRFVLDDIKFFKPFGTGREPVIFNVGIGYPF